jgi:hypothetical protein
MTGGIGNRRINRSQSHSTRLIAAALFFAFFMLMPAGLPATRQLTFDRIQNTQREGPTIGVSTKAAEYPVIKWNFTTDNGVTPTPALADVNQDGQTEVIGVSNGGTVYFLGSSGNLMWQMDLSPEATFSPTVADINGDGMQEVIVGGEGGTWCLDGRGHIAWYCNTVFEWDSPAVADVDGDGQKEVVEGGEGSTLYCLSNTGQVEWTYTTGADIHASPAVADLNGDGNLEIVVGSADSYLYCLNGTGALEWRYKTGNYIDSSPAIADVDGDGKLEVIVGSDDGNVYCMNQAGGVKWTYPTGGFIYSSPVICDIDDDGLREIVLSSMDVGVLCLTGLGTLKWAFWDSGWFEGSPAVADVDGDLHLEVLIPSGSDILCFDRLGSLKWTYPIAIQNGCRSSSESIALADIDKDGRQEIVVGLGLNICCLNIANATASPGFYPWPSVDICGDVRHTNNYVDSDGDNLTDAYEMTAGTNPNATDTDADGISDYQEFLTSSNSTCPPAVIHDLSMLSATNDSITLTWIAPGRNGHNGRISGYVVKYSAYGHILEQNWTLTETYVQDWTPMQNGTLETRTISGLTSNTTYWFALKAFDQTPIFGPISNSPNGTTTTNRPSGLGPIEQSVVIIVAAGSLIVIVVMAGILIRRRP